METRALICLRADDGGWVGQLPTYQLGIAAVLAVLAVSDWGLTALLAYLVRVALRLRRRGGADA
jgi:regulation of enolase protein 1 (concanavalin A-like superfamily)